MIKEYIKTAWNKSIFYKKFDAFVESRIEKFQKKHAPQGVLMDRKKIDFLVKKEIFDAFQYHDIEKVTKRLDADISINLYLDSVLSRLIFSGQFEDNEINFVKKNLGEGDIFLDVGANVGLFSLYASKAVGKSGKVIAFEPTPKIYERLEENIELNHLKNIETYPIAISNEIGTTNFHIAENGYDAWNSIANLNQLGEANIAEVACTTLDDFIETEKVDINRIKLIKIDVEGWELPVLQGCKNLLMQAKNMMLMVEFTDENLASSSFSAKELFEFIKSFGFNWHELDSLGDLIFAEFREAYPYTNLVARK